jgi:hypothetical protein
VPSKKKNSSRTAINTRTDKQAGSLLDGFQDLQNRLAELNLKLEIGQNN